MKNLLIVFLMLSQIFCLIPYVSPGVSVGVNNGELFITSQVSFGLSFLEDHYDDHDQIIDYFVPSVSFGLKYFPKRSHNKLFKYTDFQTTIGFIGFGKGKIKGIDNNYVSTKNKIYGGYLILYNYEKELENDYNNKSLIIVLPIPFYELY